MSKQAKPKNRKQLRKYPTRKPVSLNAKSQLKSAEGTIVPSAYGPVPSRTTVGAKYSEIYSSGTLATTVGLSTYFNLNSVNAPQSGGGSSGNPYGYSISSIVYNRYRVLSASVDVTVCQNSASLPMFFAAGPNNGALSFAVTTLGTYEEFTVVPRVKSVVVNSTAPVRVHFDIPLHAVAGVPIEKYIDDPNFSALYNGNPVEVIRFYVAFYNGSSGNATFEIYYKVNFRVIWFDPVTQSGGAYRIHKYIFFLRYHPEFCDILEAAIAKDDERKRQLDIVTSVARRKRSSSC